jgi:hypothetical protein
VTKGRACLTCNHVSFVVPDDWKPGFAGDEYDKYDVRQVIRETGHHVQAKCTFNPIWIDVNTGHYCGQWSSDVRDEESVQDFIWGSWLARENEELSAKCDALRARLKTSRQISASRLARLKSNTAAAKGKHRVGK